MSRVLLPRARLRRFSVALVAAAGSFVLSPTADAHFILDSPPSWMSQNTLGSPQKLGPCGNEGGGKASGTVTAFQAGQTITVTIDEKVFHPGHYRIALSVNDRSELPPEPIVSPGTSPCGSVDIQSPAVFPVLADGVLAHTSAFTAPQSVDIVLPSDVTCDHCTLQVIEFMSEHPLNDPGGCFYHHCADISIQAVTVDGGAPGLGDSGAAGAASASSEGANGSPASSGGCAMQAPDEGGGGAVLVFAAMVMIGVGRRRR